MFIPQHVLLESFFPDTFEGDGYLDAADERDDMANLLACLIYLVESVRDAGDQFATALGIDSLAVLPGHEGAAFAPAQLDRETDDDPREELRILGDALFARIADRRDASDRVADLPWTSLIQHLGLTRYEQIALAAAFFARASKKYASWFSSPTLWSAPEGSVDRAAIDALFGVIELGERDHDLPRAGRFFSLLFGDGPAIRLHDAVYAYLADTEAPSNIEVQTFRDDIREPQPYCEGFLTGIVNDLASRYEGHRDDPVLLAVRGTEGCGRRTAVLRAARRVHAGCTVTANLDDHHASAQEIDSLLAGAVLTAMLHDAVLMIRCSPGFEELQHVLDRAVPLIKIYGRPAFIIVNAHAHLSAALPTLVCDVPEPSEREKQSLWKWALSALPLSNCAIERLASSFANRYAMTAQAIARTVRDVPLYLHGSDGPEAVEEALAQSCYMARSHSLGVNAQLIVSGFTLGDLIVDEETRRQLDNIMDQVRYRGLVGEQWGFFEKTPYGRGVSALFFGPPGTGKTMAVQAIGNELGLDVFRVDISALVSKYIGETEKNISDLFDRARGTNAILFFDEADALFAKRSDVSDSNDRHANAETAHLLQQLDGYSGVVILATNLRENIDDAFIRRMKFVVGFRLPRAEERRRLFRSMLPPSAPTGELSLDFFADRFELSGSAIKEVVINAAYLAARDGCIEDRHIIEALKQHYVKIGKRLSDDDFRFLS